MMNEQTVLTDASADAMAFQSGVSCRRSLHDGYGRGTASDAVVELVVSRENAQSS